MPDQLLYKIMFVNQGKVYELYAKNVDQADLYGFVMIEDITFGASSGVVIDPSEERLRSEFEAVRRSYIPVHAVIRIDQVKQQGSAKIIALDGKAVDSAGLAADFARGADVDKNKP
jgi:hypothetical protein